MQLHLLNPALDFITPVTHYGCVARSNVGYKVSQIQMCSGITSGRVLNGELNGEIQSVKLLHLVSSWNQTPHVLPCSLASNR